ncbi:MAG: hypothetical protein V5A72_02465, partial [Candidatus Nanohaloarchaea archaeon]
KLQSVVVDVNFNFEIERTYKLLILGSIIGLILFFNSETFQGFVQGAIFSACAFLLIGFITENFSKYKSVILILILIVPLSLVWLTSGSLCNLSAGPGLEIKENSFTDEIKVNEFQGDPECSNLLPWYYERVDRDQAEDKIESYCSKNNESRACDAGVRGALGIAGYR